MVSTAVGGNAQTLHASMFSCSFTSLAQGCVNVPIVFHFRVAPERTSELLQQLGKHVQQPSWDDGYLAALSARNNLDPRASDMARRLIEGLPSADPRRNVVVQAFDAL